MTRAGVAVLSFLLGLLVLPLAVYLYFALGRAPAAVSDQPFPFEDRLVGLALDARIRREMPAKTPIEPTDENLNAGAQIYEDKCEECHGVAGESSAVGNAMFPRAPQLFAKTGTGAVGVSGDPASETYWKIRNGIRLTGMPSYAQTLTETQIWQVTLLLSRADKPLPDEAAKTVGLRR